jgi:hypothetical protein
MTSTNARTALEASPPEAISVDHITHDAVNNTITIVLTDSSSFGRSRCPPLASPLSRGRR